MLEDFVGTVIINALFKWFGKIILYAIFWKPKRVNRILEKHFDNSFSYAGTRIFLGTAIAAFGLAMLGFIVLAVVSFFR